MSIYLAVMFVGLAAAPDVPSGPNWLSDYGKALEQAKAERRPLLIVLDDSSNTGVRAQQVKHSAGGTEAKLLKYYTLCHVDVRTNYGRKVAQSFRATRFPYTAITDNTASVVIFRRSGDISQDQWLSTLTAYRRGQRPVSRPVAEPVYCAT